MAHSGWTQEPWKWKQTSPVNAEVYKDLGGMAGDDYREPIAEMIYDGDAGVMNANARRIVACVNACQGIPTDALEAGVLQEMREALQAMLDAFVWAQEAPPLKNPDGSRTGWQFVATRTLERARELLRRSGDPVPDRALARFLGEEASS